MMSVTRVNVRPLPDNFRIMWSEQVQRSSVLSSLSWRWFGDIQQLTSAIHSSNVLMGEAVLLLLQWRYNCVSSAYALRVTLCLASSCERSAVYKIKSRGPSTDPAEKSMWWFSWSTSFQRIQHKKFWQSGLIWTRLMQVLWCRTSFESL